MRNFIDGIDFVELEPMKYWAPTSSTSDEAKRRMVREAVFSGDYIGSLKRDGYYERIVKDEDGNCFMIARSRNVKGEVVDKLEWVPQIHNWLETLPNGTCFLCEVYFPDNEGSKTVTSCLGCLKEKAIARQKSAPLHLYVFDCIAWDGKSLMKEKFEKRVEYVSRAAANYPDIFVEYAVYYEGAELWSKLQEYLAQGNEGMVIMRKDAIVYTKRTPARVSIKVKKEIKQTIDCFFTGMVMAPSKEYTGKELDSWQYWEDINTSEKKQGDFYKAYSEGATIIPVTKSHFYGWAGSLQIGVLRHKEGAHCVIGGKRYEDTAIYPLGWLSGLTEEVRANPQKYAFKPIEVTAMEFDNITKALRHGKLLNFREDLTLDDCIFEKIC